MTKILLMLTIRTVTKERCSSWFGSRVQELSCSDITGNANDSDDDGDVDHDDVGDDPDGEHGDYESRIIVTMATMKPWQVHPAFYSTRSCGAHWMAARVSVQV